MDVILRDSFEKHDLLAALKQGADWDFIVPSPSSGGRADYDHDYWLGSSSDGQTWFLAVIEWESGGICPDDVVVALTHPPKQNTKSIGEILIRVYSASIRQDRLTSTQIRELADSVEFPEYPQVRHLFPEAPYEWRDLPCELTVGFTLSEGACVTDATFAEYRRDSIVDALQVVCEPRHDGILIHYALQARDVIPFVVWDVDWPLLRRGKEKPYERKKVQRTVPWEAEADTTLFEIYQHLSISGVWQIGPPYFGEPKARLRVGGRTPDTAMINWNLCASAIRKIRQSIVEDHENPR